MPGYLIAEYHGIDDDSEETFWIPNTFSIYSSEEELGDE